MTTLGPPTRVRFLVLCSFLLIACRVGEVEAQELGFRLGPVPDWVVAQSWTIPDDDGSEEQHSTRDLLSDRQLNFALEPAEHYRHHVELLVDEIAVQRGSQFEVVYDPNYEEVIFHSLVIHRGDQELDRLDLDRIESLQRETQLEALIYDGRVTLLLLLEDVRAGDIVEARYTIRGENPVYDGHIGLRLYQQWFHPLEKIHHRVIVPEHQQLRTRGFNGAAEPRRVERNGEVEFVWERQHAPVGYYEDYTPTGFSPFTSVQLSDFSDWDELVAWGVELFDGAGELPDGFMSQVDELWREGSDDAERIVACLRWVQNEIRYLGVETGLNSHLPSPPEEVLRRRFGDCKDKSTLLIRMLRYKGIQADPVLVSTHYLTRLGERLPAIDNFDHVIVRVRHDDQDHWVDPTDIYQSGDLESMKTSLYGHGLVLAKGETALTELPPLVLAEPDIRVEQRFELEAPNQATRLEIRTLYSGLEADQIRYSLALQTRDELQRNYVEYYAQQYPSIEVAEPLEIEDDAERNQVEVVERYEIPGFWFEAPGGRHEAEFYAIEIASHIDFDIPSNRSMPLDAGHPTHIQYICEAVMEQGWSVPLEDETVESVASSLHYRASGEDETLRIEYVYRTHAPEIAPEDVAEYLEKLEVMNELLFYTITTPYWGGGTSIFSAEEINWPMLMLQLALVVVAVLLALKVWGRRGIDPLADPLHPPLPARGIGGWLVLLAISMVVQPFALLVGYVDILEAFSLSSWTSHTTPGEANYHPLWAPVLIYEQLVNTFMIVFGVLLAVTFFARRQAFVRLFLCVEWGFFGASIIDTVFVGALTPMLSVTADDVELHVFQFFWIAIWTTYLLRSRRVGETFIKP